MRLGLQREFPRLAHPGHSGDISQSVLGPMVLCLSFSICQRIPTVYEMPVCSGDLEEPSANVTFLSLYLVGIHR